MDYIIYFIITIGILVFVHEFGHFIAAKICKMRTDVFAIGFGQRLFGYNKITGFTFGNLPKDFDGQGNTDFRLSLLPLGGYCKIVGMIDESGDTSFADKEPQPYEFRAKPTYMKVFVILGGVLMNLLLAWLIFWGANFFKGKPFTKTTTVGFVEPQSAVAEAGFQYGDKIISINNENVTTWEEVRAAIFIHTLGNDLNINVERDGAIQNIAIPRSLVPDDESEKMFLYYAGIQTKLGEVFEDTPAMTAGLQANDIFVSVEGEKIYTRQQVTEVVSSKKGSELNFQMLRGTDTLSFAITPAENGMIGVSLQTYYSGDMEIRTYGFFESFYQGWIDIVKMTDLTFTMLGKVFSGNIEFGKAFGGPVKIAKIAAESADSGFANFMYFLALLSLSLAILNIMPFPVLDGGHLVVILIEGIIRREIPIRIKMAIQYAGMVLLLMLMTFIIYNDILSL